MESPGDLEVLSFIYDQGMRCVAIPISTRYEGTLEAVRKGDVGHAERISTPARGAVKGTARFLLRLDSQRLKGAYG
jgi:hypothetical protein